MKNLYGELDDTEKIKPLPIRNNIRGIDVKIQNLIIPILFA
jgi:hypothetical protein